MIRYTDEERTFLIEFIPGHIAEEVAEEFKKRFGRSITEDQVRYFRRNNKVRCGIKTTFEKGQVSKNKGKNMGENQYKLCSRTMFKRGHRPKNYRPVGSERISVDGYVEIKIMDPNVWKLKHRVIWEEHNGKIPNGMILIFKDNNPLNISLDNLLIISRGENAELNKAGGGEFIGIAKETIINLIRLKNVTNERKKKRFGRKVVGDE